VQAKRSAWRQFTTGQNIARDSIESLLMTGILACDSDAVRSTVLRNSIYSANFGIDRDFLATPAIDIASSSPV
jgi:hypothetical protein